MRTLLFVHGIGVRGPAWFSGFDLISRKAKRYLPGIDVQGCQWGDPFGARLHRDGASIPDYEQTGDTSPAAEDSSRSRWFLLSRDPLLELRIAPKEVYFGEVPGLEIFRLIPALSENGVILELLRSWSVDGLWSIFIRQIATNLEWKLVVESQTASPAAASERISRAISAAYLRCLREQGFPLLTGKQRDELKEALVPAVGGPALGIGDWLLGRLTRFGANRRGRLSDATTPAIGDILHYQARGAELRNFIAQRVSETGASIILAHSLGGIAAVDWLASTQYGTKEQKIQSLITVGSQSPYFYEIDGLVSRTFGSGLPNTFPKKWLNIFDRADFLSFMAQPIFPDHAKDVEVDNGQPFPESHSAYWNNDDQVWETIAAFLEEA